MVLLVPLVVVDVDMVEILAQDGIEVKEGDPLLMVEAAAAGDR